MWLMLILEKGISSMISFKAFANAFLVMYESAKKDPSQTNKDLPDQQISLVISGKPRTESMMLSLSHQGADYSLMAQL